MYSKTEKLGTKTYRGQKQIVVDVLLAAESLLTREEIAARAEAAGYAKLMNDWALKKVGVRGSVGYHLRELIELGQVREDDPAIRAEPTEKTDNEKAFNHARRTDEMPTDLSDTDILDIALKHYGYGRWDAPYWFIGPEPGRDNPEDDLGARCKAWIELDRRDLVDCKKHHFGFGETRWHREVPPPATQATWRQLIRFLLAYRHGKEPRLDNIRSYQQNCWGMENGETCIIELSSLAAPRLDAPGPHGLFREQRIEEIRKKIQQHRPKLVLTYGLSHTQHFQEIVGCGLEPGIPVKISSTCFVHTPAPTARGFGKVYWLELAERLRNRSCS